MATKITTPSGPLLYSPALPASKSISNRALILKALSGSELPIDNLSDSDDTRILEKLLADRQPELYCGDGGTTLRFLIACLAAQGGSYTFTASASLSTRPLKPLTDALIKLGCRFEFPSGDVQFPLVMHSEGLCITGPLELPGDISSQFVSALMMVGPFVENGLELHLINEVVSRPYIYMTAKLMRSFGAEIEVSENRIIISQGKYVPASIKVEPDWSAATYWFEMAALRQGSEITLNGLLLDSLQGDSAIADMMRAFGVETTGTDDFIFIKNQGLKVIPTKLVFDLTDCPDTAPALICTAAGLNLTADFPGLKNFRLKECDRAAAFQRELYNFGVNTDFCGGSKFKVYGGGSFKNSSRTIKTYSDHRVAMAIAPLSLLTGEVVLDDANVVTKSYPGYWNDLEGAGFLIESV